MWPRVREAGECGRPKKIVTKREEIPNWFDMGRLLFTISIRSMNEQRKKIDPIGSQIEIRSAFSSTFFLCDRPASSVHMNEVLKLFHVYMLCIRDFIGLKLFLRSTMLSPDFNRFH